MMTFSEALESIPPVGRVYLPTASYMEMTEWALPAKAIEKDICFFSFPLISLLLNQTCCIFPPQDRQFMHVLQVCKGSHLPLITWPKKN